MKSSQIERERERVNASRIIRESERVKVNKVEIEKSKLTPMPMPIPVTTKEAPKDKQQIFEKNPFKHETILKEYDVEFYMKRGLTQTEAIDYIINKLKVKQLWSKMSTRQ